MTTTFAGRYGPKVLFDGSVRLLPGRLLQVVLPGTSTLATLYTDKNRSSTAANPDTFDGRGNVEFFAEPGDYDVRLLTNGIPGPPIKVRVFPDLDDLQLTSEIPVAADIPFTPTGTIAATDVQAAIAEVAAEAGGGGGGEPIATAHIADTTAAHAASAVAFTPTGSIAATDVQGAIAEVATEAATEPVATGHIADAVDAHDASAISFSPTGTIAATDVQAAIAEVASGGGAAGGEGIDDKYAGPLAVSESPFRNYHDVGGPLEYLRFTVDGSPLYNSVIVDYLQYPEDGGDPTSVLVAPAEISPGTNTTRLVPVHDIEDGAYTVPTILQTGEAPYVGYVPLSVATYNSDTTTAPVGGFPLPVPATSQINDTAISCIVCGNTIIPVFTFDDEDPWDGDRSYTNVIPDTDDITISAGETDVLPTATISLSPTTNLPAAGTVYIEISPGVITAVSYTGKTGTTITGCDGGAGTLAPGQRVVGVYQWGDTSYDHYMTLVRHRIETTGVETPPNVVMGSQSRTTLAITVAERGVDPDTVLDVVSQRLYATGTTGVQTGTGTTAEDDEVLMAFFSAKYAAADAPAAITPGSNTPPLTEIADLQSNRGAGNTDFALAAYTRAPNPAAASAVVADATLGGTPERSIHVAVALIPDDDDETAAGSDLVVKGRKL